MEARVERCPQTGKACREEHENAEWLGAYRAHKSPRAPRLRGYLCPFCGWWHVSHIRSKTVVRRITLRDRFTQRL